VGIQQEDGDNYIMGFTILYLSTNIIRVLNYRRMKWVGSVAHMGKRNMHRRL